MKTNRRGFLKVLGFGGAAVVTGTSLQKKAEAASVLPAKELPKPPDSFPHGGVVCRTGDSGEGVRVSVFELDGMVIEAICHRINGESAHLGMVLGESQFMFPDKSVFRVETFKRGGYLASYHHSNGDIYEIINTRTKS